MPRSTGKPRALFFPWGAGGGAAYTGHCIVLADRLVAAGYDVAFSDGGASALVRKAGFEVLSQNLPIESIPANVPAYLPFANVERVYAVAGRLYRPKKIRQMYAEDARIIDEYRPDVVVVDMAATASIAARARNIPVVSIAERDFVSRAKNSWMPWYEGEPERVLPYPSCLEPFNELRREVGVPTVEHFSDQFWGDLTIVPSIDALDPVEGSEGAKGEILYVGPMYWDPPWITDEDVNLPKSDKTRRTRVYVTLGSGGMCSDETVQAALDACDGQAWDVFVSLGVGDRSNLRIPSNATVGGFTGLTRPLRWADVVVTHGGSSTVLAALTHGKPMVVVPVMSECEMNGRLYVERAEAGQVVRYSRVDPSTGKLSFRSRYSDEFGEGTLSPSDIRRAIVDVAGDPAYAERAEHVGSQLRAALPRQETLATAVGRFV